MDDVVAAVQAAVAARDWAALHPLLHPYLHWTGPGATVVRGRRKVLARLERTGEAPEPAAVELRDGQVYRWTCS